MAEQQRRVQDADELKRRFIGVATFSALAAVAVVAAGLLHSVHRQRQFADFLEERVPALAQALEVVIGKLELGAQITSLRARSEAIVPQGQQPIHHFVLASAAGKSSVLTAPGDSVSVPEPDALAAQLSLKTSGEKSLLWPTAEPTSLIHCVGIDEVRHACALLSLEDLLQFASALRSRLVGLEISSRSRVLVQSRYQPEQLTLEFATPVRFGSEEVILKARADSSFASEFGVYKGRVIVAWALATLVLFLCLLAWRYRTTCRQMALMNAVERTRSASDQHIRTTLELVSQSGRILLWLWRDDGRVELFGPWEDEAGIRREGATPEKMAATLVRGEDVASSLKEAITNRTSWQRVYVRMVDGEPRTYQSHGMPYSDSEGNYVGLLGIASDITDALTAQGQAMRDEAYRAAQTSFLAHMAKEVSAPAMHIQAVVDLLAREFGHEVGTERRRLLDLATGEARWLSEIVRSSLELMTLRGSPVLDDLKPASVSQVLLRVQASVDASDAHRRAQHIECASPPTDEVLTHAPSLSALLEVVVRNACRYSPDGSTVRIRAYRDGPVERIEIEDEGPGIDKDDLQRLGEPFFRGETSIRIPGSGLGLATAFELARVISADIRILNSTAPDRGLLVTVSVPLRQ